MMETSVPESEPTSSHPQQGIALLGGISHDSVTQGSVTSLVASHLIPTNTVSSGNAPVLHFHSISPVLPTCPAILVPAGVGT